MFSEGFTTLTMLAMLGQWVHLCAWISLFSKLCQQLYVLWLVSQANAILLYNTFSNSFDRKITFNFNFFMQFTLILTSHHHMVFLFQAFFLNAYFKFLKNQIHVQTNWFVESHQSEVWLNRRWCWIHNRCSWKTKWPLATVLCSPKSGEWSNCSGKDSW